MMKGILRFISVGGVATLTHYLVVLSLVYLFALYPELANIFGFLSAFAISFIGHWRWTFREQRACLRFALPAFASVALGMFLLNAVVFHLLLKYASLRFELALFFAQALVVILTYVASKYWAFAKSYCPRSIK